MRFLARGREESGRVHVRSERERRKARARLERLVADAATAASTTATNALDVQLLVRVAGSASYADFKRTHGDAWRRRQLPYGVASWPEAIAEGELAVVVLPLAPGRVGLAAGKQPSPIATPVFVTGPPRRPSDYDDIVLAALLSWFETCAPGRALRLAPPVVELLQRGAVSERRIVDFGRRWSLRASDGV